MKKNYYLCMLLIMIVVCISGCKKSDGELRKIIDLEADETVEQVVYEPLDEIINDRIYKKIQIKDHVYDIYNEYTEENGFLYLSSNYTVADFIKKIDANIISADEIKKLTDFVYEIHNDSEQDLEKRIMSENSTYIYLRINDSETLLCIKILNTSGIASTVGECRVDNVECIKGADVFFPAGLHIGGYIDEYTRDVRCDSYTTDCDVNYNKYMVGREWFWSNGEMYIYFEKNTGRILGMKIFNMKP